MNLGGLWSGRIGDFLAHSNYRENTVVVIEGGLLGHVVSLNRWSLRQAQLLSVMSGIIPIK